MRKTTMMIALLAAEPAMAAPQVLTDIAPIHGLVSDVMRDIGTPTLLLPANTDGHHYTMRPSDAQAVSDADIIIRVGDALTPWLAEPLATLAAETPVLALLETDGWTLRDLHEGDEHAEHDEHDHGNVDPHAWLDPEIAAIWVVTIAEALGEADPENAVTYMENATTAAASYAVLKTEIATELAPTLSQKLMWPHAAYGYFEDQFGLTSVGAIAETDASDPGPAHIAALRDMAIAGDVDCVLIDAEINARWAQIMVDDTAISTAEVDAVGATIPLGQGFYTVLLTQLSHAIATCGK